MLARSLEHDMLTQPAMNSALTQSKSGLPETAMLSIFLGRCRKTSATPDLSRLRSRHAKAAPDLVGCYRHNKLSARTLGPLNAGGLKPDSRKAERNASDTLRYLRKATRTASLPFQGLLFPNFLSYKKGSIASFL
jgi:hypothetical protein